MYKPAAVSFATPEDWIVQSCNLCAMGLSHCDNTVFAVLNPEIAPGNPEVSAYMT